MEPTSSVYRRQFVSFEPKPHQWEQTATTCSETVLCMVAMQSGQTFSERSLLFAASFTCEVRREETRILAPGLSRCNR
jgi:hypothetical protein